MGKQIEPILLPVLFKNTLRENQHGFRSRMSTETNLLSFYCNLINFVQSGF